jgi:hypothetical protein
VESRECIMDDAFVIEKEKTKRERNINNNNNNNNVRVGNCKKQIPI